MEIASQSGFTRELSDSEMLVYAVRGGNYIEQVINTKTRAIRLIIRGRDLLESEWVVLNIVPSRDGKTKITGKTVNIDGKGVLHQSDIFESEAPSLAQYYTDLLNSPFTNGLDINPQLLQD